jgi:hypothetical protein
VIRVYKVDICLCKISWGAEQTRFVVDFDSRGFDEVFQSRRNRIAIQRINGLQHPNGFGKGEVCHKQSQIASGGASKQFSTAAGNGLDDRQ